MSKKGSGFVNNLINNLPFEAHVPGYNYCGPGTKLKKRLARGDSGINPLDEACKEHDIAYSQYKDVKNRNKADERLEYKAWDRVKSKDASVGEKAAAWSVTNIMKAKRKMGMGINFSDNKSAKMSNVLTKCQIDKIKAAKKKHTGTTIQLSSTQVNKISNEKSGSGVPKTISFLASTLANALKRTSSTAKSVIDTINKLEKHGGSISLPLELVLKHISPKTGGVIYLPAAKFAKVGGALAKTAEKYGGFLPFAIPPLVALIGKALATGAVAAAAGHAYKKATGSGVKKPKSGKGMFSLGDENWNKSKKK